MCTLTSYLLIQIGQQTVSSCMGSANWALSLSKIHFHFLHFTFIGIVYILLLILIFQCLIFLLPLPWAFSISTIDFHFLHFTFNFYILLFNLLTLSSSFSSSCTLSKFIFHFLPVLPVLILLSKLLIVLLHY